MSQDSQYGSAPDYGAPEAPLSAPTARDQMEAPAQMSPLARLGNIFFAPGDVFEDVRRSPRDWWVPMIVWLVISLGVGFFMQYRLNLTPERVTDVASEMQLEQQGKTIKDLTEQERQQFDMGKKFTLFLVTWAPFIAPFGYAAWFGIGALAYWLSLMLFQARTTYFRALSVVIYSYAASGIVQSLLQGVLTVLQDPADVDIKGFLIKKGLLATSPAAFVSISEHRVLYTFLAGFDIFSIWYLVLATIGLSLVCVKKVKLSTAAIVVVVPYLIMLLLAMGMATLSAR